MFTKLIKAGSVQLDEREVEQRLFRMMFAVYDADSSGAIDANELWSLFHDIGVIKNKPELLNVPKEAISDVVDTLDTDGSGKVEWAEFWRWTTDGGFKTEFLESATTNAQSSSSDDDDDDNDDDDDDDSSN